MDFAYMKKPLIYYLFDESYFRESHYTNCEFDYHDAFGPYATTPSALLYLIEKVQKAKMKTEDMYARKLHDLFPKQDTKNRKRIFYAIKHI